MQTIHGASARSKRLFLAAVISGAAVILCLVLMARYMPTWEAAMPDRLDLGTVYQGTQVEFDARLLTSARLTAVERIYEMFTSKLPKRWQPTIDKFHPKHRRPPVRVLDLSTVKPKVNVPRFLKLTQARPLQNTNWFQGNLYISADFVLDTTRTGTFEGNIVAAVGQRRAKLPVRVEIKSGDPLPRMLVASPFDGSATENGAEFDRIVRILSGNQMRIDYVRHLPESFTNYAVVLLADSQLYRMTTKQASELENLVNRGGRVLAFCNYFFRGTVTAANQLAGKLGMEVQDSESRGEEVTTNIVSDALTANISQLRFHRASPIQITGPQARPLVFGPGGTNCYAAATRTSSGGEFIAVTQSLWWHWVNQFATNSDNIQFMSLLLSRR